MDVLATIILCDQNPIFTIIQLCEAVACLMKAVFILLKLSYGYSYNIMFIGSAPQMFVREPFHEYFDRSIDRNKCRLRSILSHSISTRFEFDFEFNGNEAIY